jgi:hypothetical protein
MVAGRLVIQPEQERAMAPIKKDPKEEFVKEVFLNLLSRWDVKDRCSAQNLARYSYEIVDGFHDVVKEKSPVLKPKAA